MSIQTKTMVVKSDTALAETKTTIRDTVTFDTSRLPNGITYKGLKAVMSFADPIQWNSASTYDALTVVWDDATHASYASKRPVPQGIGITDGFYWLRTADLDAQVEMYRQEVQEFDGRIAANAKAVAAETARAEAAEKALGASGRTVLVVGDSYTALDSSTWAEDFAKASGMTLRKHATSSMGYLASVGGRTFLDNLNLYSNEDAEPVGLVIIYGGTNDTGGSWNEELFRNAVADCIKKAHEIYTNAKVVIAGCNRRVKASDRYDLEATYIMKAACNENNAVFVNTMQWLWDMQYNVLDQFASDLVHPSALGYRLIASKFINALYGYGNDLHFNSSIEWVDSLSEVVYAVSSAGELSVVQFEATADFAKPAQGYAFLNIAKVSYSTQPFDSVPIGYLFSETKVSGTLYPYKLIGGLRMTQGGVIRLAYNEEVKGPVTGILLIHSKALTNYHVKYTQI